MARYKTQHNSTQRTAENLSSQNVRCQEERRGNPFELPAHDPTRSDETQPDRTLRGRTRQYRKCLAYIEVEDVWVELARRFCKTPRPSRNPTGQDQTQPNKTVQNLTPHDTTNVETLAQELSNVNKKNGGETLASSPPITVRYLTAQNSAPLDAT
jgi:hypothetical protein